MNRSVLLFLAAACLMGQSEAVRPAPMADVGANLPAQQIGPDDLIAISTYDSPEFTRTVRVGSDGMIRLPMLKQRIQVKGLMPGQVETAVAEALKQEELLVDPFVTVTVAEYHSRPISVMGAVKKPVTFQAFGTVTLLDALARAEGLTAEAGQEILVSRTQRAADGSVTQLIERIAVKELIDAASSEANLKLTGGEEIRVPEGGRIYVVGNVKRPGRFRLEDNTETTVLKALALAEGLMPFAGAKAFIFRRESGGSKNEISIELKRIMDRKAPDAPLMANDILYIPDRQGRRIGLAALEKVLMFGTGATTAVIYGAAVH